MKALLVPLQSLNQEQAWETCKGLIIGLNFAQLRGADYSLYGPRRARCWAGRDMNLGAGAVWAATLASVPPDLRLSAGTPASGERLQGLQGWRRSPAAAPASPTSRRPLRSMGRCSQRRWLLCPCTSRAAGGVRRPGQGSCNLTLALRCLDIFHQDRPTGILCQHLGARFPGQGAPRGLCVCIASVVTGHIPQR